MGLCRSGIYRLDLLATASSGQFRELILRSPFQWLSEIDSQGIRHPPGLIRFLASGEHSAPGARDRLRQICEVG